MNNRKYCEKLDGKLNIVGKNIYKRRKTLKYSRHYVSDRLMNMGIDIAEHSIYQIEVGTRTIVDYEIAAFAKILKTTSDALLNDFYEYIDSI